MEKIYTFEYKDDKVIELKHDCESMDCLYCEGISAEPTQAIIAFGSNLAVDFSCPNCKEKFKLLPPKEQWKIVEKNE